MLKTTLLALAWLAFFEGKPEAPKLPLQTSDETLKCSLPAPQNIHGTIAGTSYILFEWNPVSGAAYFRVNAFTSPNNKLIYSKLVPALPDRNGVVINEVAPGTNLYIEVHSVCSNGVESPKAN